MNTFTVRSFAKINLTLDVLGIMDNGYHEVEMIMHQIGLHDDIKVSWTEGEDPVDISIDINRDDLPRDRGNLAYRAAELIIERYGKEMKGSIHIDMQKRIPVAAGLAGGSGNCAAVLHAMNIIWDLGLSLGDICSLGAELGSDVPFCVMGQAAANPGLKEIFGKDPLCTHCALASGRGTDMEPVEGIDMAVVLSRPDVAVSTPEVYRGVDREPVTVHPDNDAMKASMKAGDLQEMKKNMINVLENYTLKKYDNVMYTKNNMIQLCSKGAVLMSGSGPTVFALCGSDDEAQHIYDGMIDVNRDTFMTRTTL